MCSSHRPENGADSEPVEPVEPVEPPMQELPRANRSMVLTFLREAMPNASQQELEHEASKVEMADALGRAIHAAKRVGGPWPAPCARVRPGVSKARALLTGEDFEQVPYGYDSGEQECECEAMALHLVELMTAQASVEGVKQSSRIVTARRFD